MFRYAEVEAALAKIHRVPDESLGAFRGRIKHLQKLGVVPSSPGKGKKITYNFGAAVVWAYCLQLAEFGTDPTDIKTFYNITMHEVQPILMNDRDEEDMVMMFIPHLLSRWVSGSMTLGKGLFMAIRPASQASYAAAAEAMPSQAPGFEIDRQRLGMLNLTRLREDLKEALGPSATWVQHGEAYASKNNAP